MSFFDCIQQESTISNAFEEYFYLDGISGKLGSRRLEPIWASTYRRSIKLRATSERNNFILTTLKIASYCTLIMPLIMLVGKAIERIIFHQNLIEVVNYKPLNPEIVKKAQKIVKKITTEYYPKANFRCAEHKRITGRQFSDLRRDSNRLSHAVIHPDSGKNDLLSKFKDDPDALFLTDKSGNELKVKNFKENIDYLTTTLKAAFNSGKKVVVARLSNERHCFLVAFDYTGEILIIDSLDWNYFELHDDQLTALERSLNRANILTKEGVPISFRWDYLEETGIQKGGHMCLRFATLFAHQILKEKDIRAYEKVIGAFSEKRLKKFSDISRIDRASPVSKGDGISYEDYIPFMRSWGTHICLGVDDWRDFSLNKLSKKSIIGVYHDKTPCGLDCSEEMTNLQYFVCEKNGKQTSLDKYSRKIDASKQKLGDFIPSNVKTNVYIYYSERDKSFRIAEVSSSKRVIRTWTEDDSNEKYSQDIEDLFNQWS